LIRAPSKEGHHFRIGQQAELHSCRYVRGGGRIGMPR